MTHTRTATLMAVTLVTVSACSSASGGDSTPSTADAQAVTSSTAEPSEPAVSLPVAEVFAEPAWGITLGLQEAPWTPVVTAERVVVLDGTQVRALDAEGQEAWSEGWEAFTADERNPGSPYPLLRQVAPEVVAVVDGGRSDGEGLDADTQEVRVTLLDITSGTVIEEVSVEGGERFLPKIGESGLGFLVRTDAGEREAVAVTASGEVEALPATDDLVGVVTVGDHAFTLSGGTEEAPERFAGESYDSEDLAPGPEFEIGAMEASNAEDLLLVRFAVPYGEGVLQVLDVETGEVLSNPECDPPTPTQFVTSPGREWGVLDSMRIDANGEVECVGGGEGERRVILHAITDSGRAFGVAHQGANETRFVDLPPSGEPVVSDLAEGARLPIGVMDGDIAIHWDPEDAILTANQIKE
ncbi:hypothetical protein BJF80_13180 [Serinicoccus sp. CUA-874]|nr:hypothetical protein BJF80_13180 [Serinicoccus sp. CUA-874]